MDRGKGAGVTRLNVRRVVTGHDAGGKAVVVQDAVAGSEKAISDRIRSVHLWATFATPDRIDVESDDGAGRLSGTPPPHGGTRFGILDIDPGSLTGSLHQTDTVDYVICLDGCIELHLDDSVVALEQGDVVVQRGANHTWINVGTTTARLAFIMIDALPKRANSLKADDRAN